MKSLILVMGICLSMFVGEANAQDRIVVSQQRTVTFKCVTPADVIKGFACYTLDVGKKVIKGTGEVISAPFKAKMHFPKPRIFKWERGHWVPSRIYEVPELEIELPKDSDNALPMHFLPHYEEPPKSRNFVATSL